MSDLLDELRAMNKQLQSLPPIPKWIKLVDEEIPGRGFHKVWTTRGELVVYMTGRIFDAIPKRKERAPNPLTGQPGVVPYFGIPVYDER